MGDYTQSNRNWDTEPGGPDVEVAEWVSPDEADGTVRSATMDARGTEFVAFYTAFGVERNNVPNNVLDRISEVPDPATPHQFVDKVNPFYEYNAPQYGIPIDGVNIVLSILEDMGYTYKYNDYSTQFKFNPRPTIGEIIITGKDATIQEHDE
jgi:hypothetical protein